MKKRIISRFLILLLSFTTILSSNMLLQVNAAEKAAEDENVLIMSDGTMIFYNDSVIDGGICINDHKEINPNSLTKKTAIITEGERAVNPAPTVIPVTFQTQQLSYYCGPAAVRMVLSGIGIIDTQYNIACAINTGTNGTDFGDDLVNGMNSYVAGTAYGFFLQWHYYTSANTATMKSNMMYAINYGNPVLVNSDESDGEHIPGHGEANIIYHYACVNGYSYGGASFLYTDPAYGFTGLTSVIKNQFIPTDTLSLALGGRGYVY